MLNHLKQFWKRYVIGLFIGTAFAASLDIAPPPPVTPPINSYDCTQPIKFTITNPQGYSYSDALVLTQPACEAMTDADIAALEQQRFANTITVIDDQNGNLSNTVENINDPLNATITPNN